MRETKKDQRRGKGPQIYPDYEQKKRKLQKGQQPPYAQSTKKEKQRKVQGVRMQRNRQKQMAAKRRRRNGILICVGVFLLLAIGLGGIKLYAAMREWQGKAEKSDFTASADKSTEAEDSQAVNIAVFGTDEDGFRADVNIVINYTPKTGEVHLISVPRDTRVTMTDDMIEYLEEKGKYVPDKTGVYGQCKLTEVHAYAGEGNRAAFSVAMLEDILDVPIDYYIKVNLNAFRELVDAVGGVDFDVQDRLYYTDPVQGLYIDLYPGEQHLDGKKAEMLVRFREGYAQKDLKRIQVQQDFMRAFMEQATKNEMLLKNMDDMIRVALDYTETDMPLSKALHYAKYISKLELSSMTMDTIPGDGGSYFEADEEGVEELVSYRFYGGEKPTYMMDADELAEDMEEDTEENIDEDMQE